VDIPSYGIDIWQALWYKWECSEHFNYEDKIIAFGWAEARSYRFGLGWEERAQLAGQCFLESCVGNHLGGDTVTRCSECGEELREGVKFCPSCGARVVEVAGPRYCPECGAVIVESGDRFCPECGTSLSEGTFAEKDVPARILRVGPSPWERFKRWWQSLLWRLTPSEETKAALRNIGRVIIILVAMAAFYIVVGVALALFYQCVFYADSSSSPLGAIRQLGGTNCCRGCSVRGPGGRGVFPGGRVGASGRSKCSARSRCVLGSVLLSG